MATQALKIYKNTTTDKRIGINLTTDVNPEYTLDVSGSIGIRSTNNRYMRLNFHKGDTRVSMIRYDAGSSDENITSGRMIFFQWSPTIPATSAVSSYYEYYTLPAVTSALSSNKEYAILTAKNPVTIEQGGTGATSSAAALTNLGAAAASHTHAAADITSGTLSLNHGGTGTSAASSSALLSTLINSLSESTNNANINDFIVAQYYNGGTTHTTYYRRSLSHIFTAIPAASSSERGVVTTGEQYFGGIKHLLNPRFRGSDQYTHIYIHNSNNVLVGQIGYDSGNSSNITKGQFYMHVYSPKSTADGETTGYREVYYFPEVATGLAANKSYNIITTKNISDIGTISVSQGGTGATTLTSGAALIGNGTGAITTRSIYHQTSLGHCDYNNHINHLITDSTLAYWNGRYSDTASNLIYYRSGTIYGSGHMGWKKVTMSFSNNTATTTATGVITTSVINATRVNTDGSTGAWKPIGAAGCVTNGTIRVNGTGDTLSGSCDIYLWWSKTATGG